MRLLTRSSHTRTCYLTCDLYCEPSVISCMLVSTCMCTLQILTLAHRLLQVKRASLVDSRTAVNDVKFAPRHLGLQLVSAEASECRSYLVHVCQ